MAVISTIYTVGRLNNNIRTLISLAAKKRRPIGVMTEQQEIGGYFFDKKSFERLEQMIEDVLDIRLVKDRLSETN